MYYCYHDNNTNKQLPWQPQHTVTPSFCTSVKVDSKFSSQKTNVIYLFIFSLHLMTHLHVAGWNLLPRRKHLLWDSVHSHAHLVRLSGCVLGHTLLQLHWHVSLLKVWWGLQDFGWVLHTHWHVFLSRWRFGPQPAVLKSFWHTQRHVSSSSSLLGPQMSCSNGSLGGKRRTKLILA